MLPKKPSILFITWDGPQTNYLENLFFPIFSRLTDWHFHVIQFSWAGQEKQEYLKALAARIGISYTHVDVLRKPHPLLGTAVTVLRSILLLKSYLKKHSVDVIMPRSTFPAMMAGALKKRMPHLKIVFDADGLPLEERVDFGGLDSKGFQYRFLKEQEIKMLLLADAVLTRSNKATSIHLKNIGEEHASKFFKVSNGRDESIFKVDDGQRVLRRKKLGLDARQLLLVYCGSLGPQYGLDAMFSIFHSLLQKKPDSRFMILTPQVDYLDNKIPLSIQYAVTVMKGPYSDIPFWLNAADLAFAIREPKFSMQGVFPIKIGEYLLMGIPTICSKGIGDTEEIVQGQKFVYLFDHHKKEEINNVIDWIKQPDICDKNNIRNFALQYFTLTKSVAGYQKALTALIPLV